MLTVILPAPGWNDIGYSFLVGGDGKVYEGRGWNHVRAHTSGYNSEGIGKANVQPCTTWKLYCVRLQLRTGGRTCVRLSIDACLLVCVYLCTCVFVWVPAFECVPRDHDVS